MNELSFSVWKNLNNAYILLMIWWNTFIVWFFLEKEEEKEVKHGREEEMEMGGVCVKIN